MLKSHAPQAAAALIAVTALVLAACGGDNGAAPPQPTNAPAATATPRPTGAPTATKAPRPTSTPTATAAPRPTTAPTSTPARQPPTATPAGPTAAGDAVAGRQLFLSQGCAACHAIAGIPGASGQVGPALTGVAALAGQRVPGLSAEQYLRQSILEPNAFVVKGFQPVMPAGLAQGKDVDNLVAFLLTLK